MSCRWKDKDGNHLYDSFIPEVERPLNADGTNSPDPHPGEKRKLQPRRPLTRVLCTMSTVATYMNISPVWMGHVSTLFQLDEDAPEGA